MTKRDMILKITNSLNTKQNDTKRIVQKVFDFIILELKQGRRIELRGFGVFYLRKSRKRTAFNFSTNKVISVKPKIFIKFKQSSKINL